MAARLVAVGAPIAAYVKKRLRKRAERRERERVTLDAAPAGLAPRPLMRADSFEDRDAKLTRIGEIIANGKKVIWIVGTVQVGKTWLVCRYLRDDPEALPCVARFPANSRCRTSWLGRICSTNSPRSLASSRRMQALGQHT